MTIRSISRTALALAGLLGALPAQAVSIFGQDFQLNNVAAYGANFVQLTRSDVTFYRGSATMSAPLSLVDSFDVAFSFRILGGTDGADGFTLAFQNSDFRYLALPGGNLGFYTVSGLDGRPLGSSQKAYAVAIDTYKNADYGNLDNNHVSTLDNSTYQTRHAAPAPWDLNSGEELFAWVQYDAPATQVSVFLNDSNSRPASALLVDTIDLRGWLGERSFVGFTAATGGLTNAHVITSFALTHPVPEPSSWALMAAGLGMVSLAAWRRRGFAASAPAVSASG